MGGAERHLSLVLPRISTSLYRPLVITLTHKGVLSDQLERQGIQVIQPNRIIRASQRIPVLKWLAGPLLTVAYLVVTYKKSPAMLTCFYLPHAYYLGCLAALLAGDGKNLVMFRRSLNHYQMNFPMASMIERVLHKKQKAIIANSRAVLQELLEREGVEENKARVIYNGVEVARFEGHDKNLIRRDMNLGPHEKILCIVANLIPYKGHEDLIDALSTIAGRTAYSWKLLCVGAGEKSRREALAGRARSRGLENHIVWLGPRDDVPRILAASDICVVASHQEGFSNAVLEGMASGLPMIVTDAGGNAEAVENGSSGVVVKPHDPPALGNAILQLMNDAGKAQRFGMAAKQRVRDCFSLEKCVADYHALFRDVLRYDPGEQ